MDQVEAALGMLGAAATPEMIAAMIAPEAVAIVARLAGSCLVLVCLPLFLAACRNSGRTRHYRDYLSHSGYKSLLTSILSDECDCFLAIWFAGLRHRPTRALSSWKVVPHPDVAPYLHPF